MVTGQCLFCAKEFSHRKSQSRKFCSRACASDYSRGKPMPVHLHGINQKAPDFDAVPPDHGITYERVCPTCGSAFNRRRSAYQIPPVYCSPRCLRIRTSPGIPVRIVREREARGL